MDSASESAAAVARDDTRKKMKKLRVRKDRQSEPSLPTDAPPIMTSYTSTARAAGIFYLVLVLLRAFLALTPGVIEAAESADGADFLAATILPNMASPPPALPEGMRIGALASNETLRDVSGNYTRSIVGAFVSSGIPYIAVNVACNNLGLASTLCAPAVIGRVAVYAPRLWMFLLSLLGDVMLVWTFAVYNSEYAVPALLTYASSWMGMLAMARNTNFALEALCLLGLISSCFGWTYASPRPVFWLSATALALGIFLRPIFAVFVCTPLIYLVSLWGKPGVDPLHYARALLEGLAIFGAWSTLWVTVDSVFYGAFKLRFGGIAVESVDSFVKAVLAGTDAAGPFSYKGFLVYTPLNACAGLFTRAFWTNVLRNTSPGQMFVQLPVVLGPLMIMLIRESIDGMKIAMKELMGEFKSATGQKVKKRKKKGGVALSKEREEEMLVYYDTIQTTLLLGLLLEVMQSHDRLGVMSLLALNAPAIMCVAQTVFGPGSSFNVRIAHFLYTAAMVVFYGAMHQSGVARTLISAGAGGVDIIKPHSDLVIFRGLAHHPSSALGANIKGLRVHDGGVEREDLMVKLRHLKEKKGYHEDKLLVCAAGTLAMKDEEFELVDRVGFGHMSVDDLPVNLDEFFTSNRLHLYKFIGNEDEAMMRDREEAEEQEEADREKKRSRK